MSSKPGKYTDDQFTANWDREFNSSKDKLSSRFFFSNSETLLPFGAGGLQASLGGTLSSSISATDLDFPYDIPVAARFLAINETHLVQPRACQRFPVWLYPHELQPAEQSAGDGRRPGN